MYIRKLKILNSKYDTVIREVKFHKGANFIVDTSDSKHHNKVGKTTFLKLIDVALGAKKKTEIYTDSETGSINNELESFINNNKCSVELSVVDDLDRPNKETVLKVDLFLRGSRYINGNKLNYNDYKDELNVLFFKNKQKFPSFRQLIKPFVRISLSGDNDSFIKFLDRGKTDEYRGIYNFLFNISDPNIDHKLGELKTRLKTLEGAEKQYKRYQNTDNLEEMKQVIEALNIERKNIQSQLENIVSADVFIKNQEQIELIRQDYSELTESIMSLQFKRELNKHNFEKLQKNARKQVDNYLTKQFFDEVKDLVPSVNKTFQDLLLFNEKLQDNKEKYLVSVEKSLTEKIELLEKKRQNLISDNEALISLVQNNKISEYNELLEELAKRDREISERETIQNTLVRYTENKEEIEKEIEKLSSENQIETDDFKSRVDKFNHYFRQYANVINNEKPLMIYFPETNQFPVKLTDINEGTSTGTRKSLIAAFDLAYQKFAEVEKKSVPNFIVHDVLENIESENLSSIIDISNQINTQYVIAILEENLSLAIPDESVREEYKILKLSNDDKLFEGKEK